MAVTGMPTRGLPELPISQTSDITPPGLDITRARSSTGVGIPNTQALQQEYQKQLNALLTLLSHPLFRQLMQAGQSLNPAKPEKFQFHVPTGGVAAERYPLPQVKPPAQKAAARQGA